MEIMTSIFCLTTDLIDVAPSDLYDLLLGGEYEAILGECRTQRFLARQVERGVSALRDPDWCGIDTLILKCSELDVGTSVGSSELASREMLCVGVACLQLFVQNNWVGPPTEVDPVHFLPSSYNTDGEQSAELVDLLSSVLSVDGEMVYCLSRYPLYLCLARIVLHTCVQNATEYITADWWLMRCLQTQQALLTERSPTLKKYIEDLITNVASKDFIHDDKYRDAAIQFHLEAGHLCYFYYMSTKAGTHFDEAYRLSGLHIHLTGALGKRTRFQQESVSQLVLEVRRPPESVMCENQQTVVTSEHLPLDVNLDDDTVLEKIKFNENELPIVEPVTPTEQALILGLCHKHRTSHEGQGKIIQEEAMAYMTAVLSDARHWTVQCTALLQRARLQQDSSRLLERSMKQLEELVQQFKVSQSTSVDRLSLIYCLKLPPIHSVERELADLFMKMGATNAALEVYLRLQIWTDVIKCYSKLGRREKAEAVLREQLAIRETPDLWCTLGDVTHDRTHYETAWSLSAGRSALSQRSLAYWHLQRYQYEQALPYFKKSLEINALQVGAWFSYGCALLAGEQYKMAATAFRRCVNLNSDNFEAWNNLATAYIRDRQISRAFLALQEALKCEYENWRIWDNYMLVGVDCGEFQEAIRAYHRILDLKDKHVDTQVLDVLVKAVLRNETSAKGEGAAELRKPLLELFGHITAKVQSDSDVWRLYAELTSVGEPSKEDRQKALQHLQKSHRCSLQVSHWQREPGNCKKVAQQAIHLAKAYLQYSEDMDSGCLQSLSSARLMLKNVITAIKREHVDPTSDELVQVLCEPCQQLEDVLQQTIDTTVKLRS